MPPPRGIRAAATLLAMAFAAAGCVYDPYTGAYEPCCAAPAYGAPYPAAVAPQSLPQQGSPTPIAPYGESGQPGGAYESPSTAQAPGVATPFPDTAGPKLTARFDQANVTRDGMLTYQQARDAQWGAVARNFAAIDTFRRGYVTLGEIRAWQAARRRPGAGYGAGSGAGAGPGAGPGPDQEQPE